MEIVTKHKPTIQKYTRSRLKHITQVFNVEKTLSGKKLHQEKRSSCIIFTKGDYKYIHFLCPPTFTLVEPGYLYTIIIPLFYYAMVYIEFTQPQDIK